MNKKSRTLHLLKYFYEFTDEEHTVTTADLRKFYEENGYSTNRNTIRDDIESINEVGFKIITERRGQNVYYMRARPFENVEVRMLIDAVASAQFICEPKTHQLISKLSKLSDSIEPFPYTIPVHKTDNCLLYYYINEIELAIQEKKKIRFHYYEYQPDKKKVFRHDGAFYIVSPYALMCKEDRYYLLGWNEARESANTFRVDLLCDVTALDEPGHEQPGGFSIEHYGKRVSRMYDGEEREVTLSCENHLMTKLIDKFGNDFEVSRIDKDHFRAQVRTGVSKTFYAWAFQYAGEITILGPADVAEEYRAQAERVIAGLVK